MPSITATTATTATAPVPTPAPLAPAPPAPVPAAGASTVTPMSLSLPLSGDREAEKDPGSSLLISESVIQNNGNKIGEFGSLLLDGNGNQILTETKDNRSAAVDTQINENEIRENATIELPVKMTASTNGGFDSTNNGNETMQKESDISSNCNSSLQSEAEKRTERENENDKERGSEIAVEIKSEKQFMEMTTETVPKAIQQIIKTEKILDLTIPDLGPSIPKPSGPPDAAMKRAETKRKAQSQISDAHYRYVRGRSNMKRGLREDGREMDISALSRVASMAAVYLHLTGECRD